MRLMYGTPPSPGAGRDLAEALKKLERSNPPPEVKPVDPSHQFTWNSTTFTWLGDARFDGIGDGWDASVWPNGLRWKALVRVGGGKQEGHGDSPTDALNAAQLAWSVAVAKIGT